VLSKQAKPVILVDTREKNPWKLDKSFKCKSQKLDTADYSIEGFEDQIAIEKKADLNEFIADISGRYRPTFKRFLNRLSQYPVKAIIIDDSLARAPEAIRETKGTRLDSSSVYYWVTRISLEYGIPVIFTGGRKTETKKFLNHFFRTLMMDNLVY
jgi:ERCC4-type nuclease